MVVPPAYPADLLAAGVTGTVDLNVHVPLTGRISEVVRIASEPKQPAFEKEVLEVVKLWFFYRQTNCECVPVPANVKLRIWFDIKDGKPSISVSSAAKENQARSNAPKLINRAELSRTLKESYPRQARRAQAQADVYVSVSIDGRTGANLGAEMKWISSNAYDMRNAFANAAVSSLETAKFEAGTSEAKKPLLTCFSIRYRLRGESDH